MLGALLAVVREGERKRERMSSWRMRSERKRKRKESGKPGPCKSQEKNGMKK